MDKLDLIPSFQPLLTKLKDNESYTLFIVGKNGSGKTTLVEEIKELYKDCGFYTTSENIQFNSLDVFDNEKYKDGLLSRFMSNGESLYKEVFKLLENSEVIILDEPTSTLDFLTSSLLFESFIRSTAKIRVFTTNDVLCLKQLSKYTNQVYNVECNEFVDVNEYINNIIDDTIKELKNTPFQQIPFDFYENLK